MSKKVELDGELVSKTEYCRRLGYSYSAIDSLMRRKGLDFKGAVSQYLNIQQSKHFLQLDGKNVSVAECLDLAFELSFKRLLNPAVITACKNLDELDSYLDCLESKQLSNFGVFEVKYDISPLVKKH